MIYNQLIGMFYCQHVRALFCVNIGIWKLHKRYWGIIILCGTPVITGLTSRPSAACNKVIRKGMQEIAFWLPSNQKYLPP